MFRVELGKAAILRERCGSCSESNRDRDDDFRLYEQEPDLLLRREMMIGALAPAQPMDIDRSTGQAAQNMTVVRLRRNCPSIYCPLVQCARAGAPAVIAPTGDPTRNST
jgi:hypothetical protein